MNKEIQAKINWFLYNIATAGNNLSEFSQEIANKDNKIKKIISEFNIFINNIEIKSENKELNIQLQETLKQYKSKAKVWDNLIGTYISGKEFINQFEKSLLFVVFGNVNVGKSSIGNFIAGVPEELKKYYNEIPNFYVYDFANNHRESTPVKLSTHGFKENDTEETTSIQYYTLNNGLTWVDSPGIHSINGENEDLAKKYVDYADLVVFVMSSSSPAKHDEFLEVSRLINKQKPLLVIINKSDKEEFDEIDDEIVKVLIPKSEMDRRKQEDYVKGIFENSKTIKYAKSIDSISTSTRLAKKALLEDNSNKFILSGIPKFYDKLGDVLKNSAIELKMKAPIQRINALIDELISGFSVKDEKIDGIYIMINSFKEILISIENSIEEVNKLRGKIIKEVRVKSMPEIDIEVSRLAGQLQMGKNINGNTLKKNIEDIILNNFNIILQKHISRVLNDFKHKNIQNLNLNINTGIENKYETITYTEYSVREVSRDPHGFIEHIGAFFGKEYSEIKTSSHQVNKQIVIGDNSSEVIENIILSLENQLEPIATKIINEIADDYFKQEKALVQSIVNKLLEIECLLTKEKIKVS